ncbi:contactin-associated protein like 5-1-like [Hydractinia symbiolongicarpus]|uniref:contactin-associated protein like 5-1-like n=1 Tax=Hydractinia symbiolongicarpus TaxID=13093 RepID=UPI00254C12DF|nr:contactin-associated protein like 5-1-like [Hydractinia symbiolongicarpus]
MKVSRVFFCLAFLYALFNIEVTTINLRSLERSSFKKKALFRRVFSGKYLDKPKLAQHIVDNFRECGILCFKDASCYSFNHQRNGKNCDLLSVDSMDTKMSDFVHHSDWNYYDSLSAFPYESCKEGLQSESVDFGWFYLKPVGQMGIIEVHCRKEGTEYYVDVHHDNEEYIRVDKMEAAGSFSHILKYNATSLDAVISLVKQSVSCTQYAEMACHNANPYYTYNPPYIYLKDRHGSIIPYWAGGNAASYCSCGITGTCYSASNQCNCDSSITSGYYYDKGEIKEKERLPLTAIHGGDTGYSNEWLNLKAKHLICKET